MYRILKNNKWSTYNVISNTSKENFSAILFPDDTIYVLYQNEDNNIILSKYGEEKWTEKQILQNTKKDMLDIYFKAVLDKDKIHIFYSITNLKSKESTFFYQIADKDINLSAPKVVDTIKLYDTVPFIIHVSKQNTLFLMYQKNINGYYEIGYRQLSNKGWSKFFTIEKNQYPYSDYSLLCVENSLQAVYIRVHKEDKELIYCRGNYPKIHYNEIFKSKDIQSCAMFILKDNIWIIWIDKDKIYSCLSLNDGEKFSMPPHHEAIISDNLIKCTYKSNFSTDKEFIQADELYLYDNDTLRYIIISDIYPYITNVNKAASSKKYNNYWKYIKDYMGKAYNQIFNYEKLIKEKERDIMSLNCSLSDKKLETRDYQNKLRLMERKYDESEKEKDIISENINSLEETIISRDKKINELENINLEKENQIRVLNNKINELEKSLSSFREDFSVYKNKVCELEDISTTKEDEIVSLKNTVDSQSDKIIEFEVQSENLRNKIDVLQTKVNSSNTSILKKIFGNTKESE